MSGMDAAVSGLAGRWQSFRNLIARLCRLVTWPFIPGATLFLSACAMPIFDPPSGHVDGIVSERFLFKGGGYASYYILDKNLPAPGAKQVATFLFFVSGSGCTSMRRFLPRYFRGLEGESGPIRVFILQKRFIEEDRRGRASGCTDAFVKADHPAQWIADQQEFIRQQIERASAEHRMPARVVIAGASEGAEIVPVLARRIPETTHAVLIGNGGMAPIDTYRLQLERRSVPDARAILKRIALEPADPDALDNLIGGHTWRYWAELSMLHPGDDLLGLAIPVWVAMGSEDQAVPVASALYLRDLFAAHDKSNLTLTIYPGADHALFANSHPNLVDWWFAFDRAMGR